MGQAAANSSFPGSKGAHKASGKGYTSYVPSVGKAAPKGAGKNGKNGKKALTATEEKILRHVGFINKTAGLQQPLDYWRLKPAFDLVDEKQAFKCLDKLREFGSVLPNPGGWVKRFCEKKAAKQVAYR